MRQPPSRASELNPLDFGPCDCPNPDCELKNKAPADRPESPALSALRAEIREDNRRRRTLDGLYHH
ncbi:hypothetical protein [Streptomyces yaizuensis]|uniref:Uncharacterized protein n=1 Tax=Streptomyces yaizuensis TaxID=2989713 RepID=A0ABQ5P9V2_9ACTN|nr:hypothetical protein [Streptomyces sp. YSPA8]GLF99370.1 hypothetical protein SYYSPA8_33755 [Streptomyces sp. YSPA8]